MPRKNQDALSSLPMFVGTTGGLVVLPGLCVGLDVGAAVGVLGRCELVADMFAPIFFGEKYAAHLLNLLGPLFGAVLDGVAVITVVGGALTKRPINDSFDVTFIHSVGSFIDGVMFRTAAWP